MIKVKKCSLHVKPPVNKAGDSEANVIPLIGGN